MEESLHNLLLFFTLIYLFQVESILCFYNVTSDLKIMTLHKPSNFLGTLGKNRLCNEFAITREKS